MQDFTGTTASVVEEFVAWAVDDGAGCVLFESTRPSESVDESALDPEVRWLPAGADAAVSSGVPTSSVVAPTVVDGRPALLTLVPAEQGGLCGTWETNGFLARPGGARAWSAASATPDALRWFAVVGSHRHGQRRNRNMGVLDRGRKTATIVTNQDRAETSAKAATAVSSSRAFGGGIMNRRWKAKLLALLGAIGGALLLSRRPARTTEITLRRRPVDEEPGSE